MPPTNRLNEYYPEYWLCVLGVLARKGEIGIANYKLARTKLHFSWPETNYFEEFFIDSKDYISEVCNGSIQTCEKILEHFGKPSECPIPPNYINTKEIFEIYKVPGSTLEGWKDKDDKVDVRHYKRLNYYPREWVEEKKKTYKPKPPKTVT